MFHPRSAAGVEGTAKVVCARGKAFGTAVTAR